MAILGFGANYADKTYHSCWPVVLDGKYSKIIRDYLTNDGIPEDGVSQIIENGAKVLSYCPNPLVTSPCKKTGIVIGKVQSGKTSNFITLSALAFDNGYNLVLVLGGTKKILVTQNRKRIKEYFEATDDVVVLDTVNYRGEIDSNTIQKFIKMGKKVIVVALKNDTQISFVKDRVFNKGSSLVEKPTLIIDDEGDEASLNTLVKKGKKSSTYSAIESLKNVLDCHCFISVTATPQANMLIDTLDVLSPDYGVLVDPGKGYCGLDVFHSDDTYTVTIPDGEQSLLDEGIPKSFVTALAMFFVACAIYKRRGMKHGDKMSMLIHPSQLKADHKSVFKKVDKLIENWIGFSNDKNDIAYEDLKCILLSAYNNYACSTVKNIPEFSAIEDDIIQAINVCGKHIVNGDSDSNNADDIYDFNIYVGGTMLGRGLTLQGLTITYIIRTSKGVSSADTVQQRARWFGYKSKYLDLCRVFAVGKILKEFREIRDHEDDLWETVREANLQGEQFKNIARIFVLSDDLRMTRQNVASATKFTFSFWNKQKMFQFDEDYNRSNNEILGSFKDKYSVKKRTERYGSGAPYTIIPSDFQTVYKEILNMYCYPDDRKLNRPLVTKLKNLLDRKKINPEIEVIWMRDDVDSFSRHYINSDGSIGNYSVGRRPKEETKTPVYRGDDYQFKKDGWMQLQIHNILDLRTNIVSPTLVLYLPPNVVEKLTNLVIQK